MRRKKKNPIMLVIVLGVGLGLLLLAIENLFDLSHDTVWSYYIRLAPVIIIAAVIGKLILQLRFRNKVMAMNRILIEEKDADRFIAENEALLQCVGPPYNRAVLMLNISAGYSDKKEYQRAKETLLQIPVKALQGINRVIYYNNLAYFEFKLEEFRDAVKVMDEHRKEFDRFEKNRHLGKHIIVNRIYRMIFEGKKTKAELLLDSLQKENGDSRFLNELENLQRLIGEMQEDTTLLCRD